MATTGRDRPSFGTRDFLFALILAFTLYLLVSDMVSHHFFGGGAPVSPKTLQSLTPFGSGPAILEPLQENTIVLLQNEFFLKLYIFKLQTPKLSSWPLASDVYADEQLQRIRCMNLRMFASGRRGRRVRSNREAVGKIRHCFSVQSRSYLI